MEKIIKRKCSKVEHFRFAYSFVNGIILSENIELIDFASRGLISQNVLSQSRHLVEHVAMKAYSMEHVMNYQLMANGYPPVSIAKENRLEYFNTLESYAVEGKLAPFAEIVAKLVEQQLDSYLSMMEAPK